jgi:hypothetical protein
MTECCNSSADVDLHGLAPEPRDPRRRPMRTAWRVTPASGSTAEAATDYVPVAGGVEYTFTVPVPAGARAGLSSPEAGSFSWRPWAAAPARQRRRAGALARRGSPPPAPSSPPRAPRGHGSAGSSCRPRARGLGRHGARGLGVAVRRPRSRSRWGEGAWSARGCHACQGAGRTSTAAKNRAATAKKSARDGCTAARDAAHGRRHRGGGRPPQLARAFDEEVRRDPTPARGEARGARGKGARGAVRECRRGLQAIARDCRASSTSSGRHGLVWPPGAPAPRATPPPPQRSLAVPAPRRPRPRPGCPWRRRLHRRRPGSYRRLRAVPPAPPAPDAGGLHDSHGCVTTAEPSPRRQQSRPLRLWRGVVKAGR